MTEEGCELRSEEGLRHDEKSHEETEPKQIAVIKSGFLTKRGDLLPSWKVRWFVLRSDSTLSYYARGNIPFQQQEPKGVIALDAKKIIVKEDHTTQHDHCFSISAAGREFLMNAQSEASKREWIVAIKKAAGQLKDDTEEIDLIGEEIAREQEKIIWEKERLAQKEELERTRQMRITNVNHLLRCPLSQKLMVTPVICSDGYTYELENALAWFEMTNVSPVTGEVLSCFYLRPNRVVSAFLDSFQGHFKVYSLNDDIEEKPPREDGGHEDPPPRGDQDHQEIHEDRPSMVIEPLLSPPPHRKTKDRSKTVFDVLRSGPKMGNVKEKTSEKQPKGLKTRKLKDKGEKEKNDKSDKDTGVDEVVGSSSSLSLNPDEDMWKVFSTLSEAQNKEKEKEREREREREREKEAKAKEEKETEPQTEKKEEEEKVKTPPPMEGSVIG